MKRVLACVNIFCMQSVADAQKIEQLGAATERIRVVGNLKFDTVLSVDDMEKQDLGFRDDEDLLIAGSTHPGEEAILLDVYERLSRKFDQLRLVLAPRHVERAEAVIKLVRDRGFEPIPLSRVKEADKTVKSIVVVDTIGQLRALYSLAKIVFIGKTLMVGGGQNMIEPAYFGKPTIVGPLTQNFKDAVGIFLKANALIQIKSSDELIAEIESLLADENKARRIGEAAKQVVHDYRGATSKTIDAITEVLN